MFSLRLYMGTKWNWNLLETGWEKYAFISIKFFKFAYVIIIIAGEFSTGTSIHVVIWNFVWYGFNTEKNPYHEVLNQNRVLTAFFLYKCTFEN